ncbi:MAG: DUF488 domain-containing protein [Phycisphaerae bacterium]
MKLYTIGYGGRSPVQFLDMLRTHSIRTVVDVRLRPDRSSMGVFAQAKDPQKGIQRLLATAGIEYVSFIEMGNMFIGIPDWARRYRQLIERAGDLLTQQLDQVREPACLMCAEKRAADCHRSILAEYLTGQGHMVEHLE